MKKVVGGVGIIAVSLFGIPSAHINEAYIKATAITHAKFGNGRDASGRIIYNYVDKVNVKTNADKVVVGATNIRGKGLRNKKIESVAVVENVEVQGHHRKTTLDILKKRKKVENVAGVNLNKNSRVRKVVTYIKDVKVKQK
jgi:translation initiation factor 1 (eIF-1/SUI1)